MVDWDQHYDAIYEALGVEAELTVPGTEGGTFDLTVIDKTQGIEVTLGGDIRMNTIAPACAARVRELEEKSISRSTLRGAGIVFNSKSWTVETLTARPAPTGEAKGEIFLILTETADDQSA